MVESQRGERMALGHAREGDQAVVLRMLSEEFEVETARDVGRARPVEEILDRPVRSVAVSGAARLAHPAVVDQHRVAGVGEPGGHFLDERDRAFREDGFLSVSQRDVIGGRWVAEMFDESIVVERDHHLLRPGRGATQAAEGKVVHELVREDQLRGALQSLGDPDPFVRVECPTSPRARFDGRVRHVQVPKVLDELTGERSVTRTDLGQPQWSRISEPGVQIHDRATQQLREHRVHVRAGHEMTVGADGRMLEEPSGTLERELHVFGERDRSVVPDRAGDGVARIHGLQGTASWVASVLVSNEIRQAASLIGVRDGSDGPEVLVIERTLGQRFLPGYVAFPGGAIDPTDGELAERWFGDEEEAVRAAAVRELAEEVGLAVTQEGVVAVDPDEPLAPIHVAPPGLTRLPEIARWIAPERVPVRFDARYYAVRMDEAAEPTPDGAEAAKAWWASPRWLMSAWESEELLFYWPTHFTMRALADCRDADELLGLRIATREPDDDETGRLPRSVFYQD